MKEVSIIFPHQLFQDHPAIKTGRPIYLIEEFLFFNQYSFHKQKLAFHRTSMKQFEAFLTTKKHEVHYIESQVEESDIRKFFQKYDFDKVHIVDPVDDYLLKRIRSGCKSQSCELNIDESPAFLTSQKELQHFFDPEKKHYAQSEFYIQQRKSLNILVDKNAKPEGGKWSFDAENRKKYPAKKTPPNISFPNTTDAYKEALDYVEKHFKNNPGEIAKEPIYPTSHESAEKWLQQFLEYRFAEFGDYEDAIVARQSFLHHSVLSPLLNSGLLTPAHVVDEILAFAEQNNISLNNTEGIIRQIIGWREFVRGVYEAKGSKERTRNFWGFGRKIPDSFYSGKTGIEPVDICIKKMLKTGYNHHIERLMVLGNFMLLCEFDPDDVYQWFMEMYIDSYDWVMVPNVYGMSQFADGGMMSTKPYISGSNYLMKMSDFKKGDWQKTWDALFWRFMHVHRDFFLKNPRMGMLIRTFDKMDKEKRENHLKTAEEFLKSLD